MINDGNGAFSKTVENLQIVWDATSIRQLQFCPRSYQLGILQGWRGSVVDLEFGIYFANGAEEYAKSRLAGNNKDRATRMALKRVVEDTWLQDSKGQDDGSIPLLSGVHRSGGKPWGGYYANEWHCLGTTKYKNAKGNRAKCPFAHAGKWFPGDGPHTCGECGSCTLTERHYIPNDDRKNRESLVTAIAYYCFEQPDNPFEGGLYPIAFPDGTPAVELSFKLPLPYKAPDGQTYVLSGHMDGIKAFTKTESFVSDNKTTVSFLGPNYWKQYSPNTQVDIYDLVGSMLYPDLGIRGVAIEAVQLKANSTATFATHPFYRTEGQREETLKEIGWWLRQAEVYVENDYWPMNKTNCKMCSFNGICSKDPAQRERYLKADFTKQRWDPSIER
jgi:hypothetical protein